MSSVFIDLGSRSYTIHIGRGLLASAGQIIKEVYPFISKAMVVTNPTVNSLYGHEVFNSLEEAGITPMLAEIPDGEEYKALSIAEGIYDLAYTAELDRKTPIIALGGGVVGDLAGFAAATYLRGVPFVQIPTTLLAQVDSSVGGKVAVNHPRGKNIIGAFYQPSVVMADLSTLKTLDQREMRAGMSEVIKYGVISDEKFFGWLEKNLERAMEQDSAVMENIVAVSCRIKAGVVQEDETEQGRRAILNFGHTVGHAVESLTGYGVYRHGEAVAVGMAAAARISEKMGLLDSRERQRLERLLNRAGLPVSVPVSLDRKDLISSMRRDKKVISSRLTFVIPEAIGRVRMVRDLDEGLIVSCL
ncbi:MAG: 3-dehydroquinate synthase [Peptococcaceae bacterium BRH_c4a]|nr:MAG: 3-dehydroquinate synthase [Peptococcaceae bacterium BRH_c4a]